MTDEGYPRGRAAFGITNNKCEGVLWLIIHTAPTVVATISAILNLVILSVSKGSHSNPSSFILIFKEEKTMFTVLEKRVLSSDGVHELIGKIYLPEGERKGYFHLVHGMDEYIGRYENTCAFLAEQGYIVFAYDHLGHGATGLADNSLGFFASKDGWRLLVKDVKVFADAVRAEYGDLPYYLMGHSMGSFVVRLTTVMEGAPDKLIIMGTGGPNPAAGAGIAMAKCLRAIKGEKGVSKPLLGMAFGAYNARFKEEKDRVAWLTKNKKVRENYKKDPLCTFPFTVSAMEDLVTLNKKCNTKAHFDAFPKTLPTLFVSGTEDPVGDYGKGVTFAAEELTKRGCKVTKKLYENCRHEILNDTCRDEVLADILAFIKK